ncbi:MAG: DUF106 domain-containing protein [Thermoplasmata archaeon]
MTDERPRGSDVMRSLMYTMIILSLMVLFIPQLRQSFGEIVGIILEPIIGFKGEMAVVSLMLAGFITGTISIVIRHFTTDWVGLARSQKTMAEFNKLWRETLMSGNYTKLEKLKEIRNETMQESLNVQKSQLKTFGVTMFMIIIIFAWLMSFVNSGIVSPSFSVPWSYDANMKGIALFIPHWVLLYAVLSSPLTLLLPRILKWYTFKKRLESEEEEELAVPR